MKLVATQVRTQVTYWPPGAVDIEFLISFRIFLSKKLSRGSGSGLKSFLDALGAVLAKYHPKRSHGDPKQTFFYMFNVFCCVATRDMCSVARRDMCCVARRDMCCVTRRDMCCVA